MCAPPATASRWLVSRFWSVSRLRVSFRGVSSFFTIGLLWRRRPGLPLRATLVRGGQYSDTPRMPGGRRHTAAGSIQGCPHSTSLSHIARVFPWTALRRCRIVEECSRSLKPGCLPALSASTSRTMSISNCRSALLKNPEAGPVIPGRGYPQASVGTGWARQAWRASGHLLPAGSEGRHLDADPVPEKCRREHPGACAATDSRGDGRWLRIGPVTLELRSLKASVSSSGERLGRVRDVPAGCRNTSSGRAVAIGVRAAARGLRPNLAGSRGAGAPRSIRTGPNAPAHRPQKPSGSLGSRGLSQASPV